MTLKDRWRLIRPDLLSGIAYAVLRLVNSTIRVKLVGFEKLEDEKSAILCGWHGRSFIFTYEFRNHGCWVIISQSRDGDLQTSIFKRLGYRIIRGSTGRGGVRAAVESIRALREGGIMAMTPDGPRGPSHIVQPGVLMMARKSGAPMYPVGVSAKRRILAKSWDSYLLPFPFTRGTMIVGDPFYVPADATEEEVEAIRVKFQDAMNAIEAEADRAMGHTG